MRLAPASRSSIIAAGLVLTLSFASGVARVMVPLAADASTSSAPPLAPSLDEVRRLIDQARYADAEAAASRALAEAESTHGADALEAADALDVLVEARWRAGKSREPDTMALIDRAVRIKEKHLGPEHVRVAASLNLKGNLLMELADYTEARKVRERVLSIRQSALGAEHADVAAALASLGNVLMETGDHGGARGLYERSLVIQEKTYGPEDIRVARALNRLAILLRTTGDYAGARPLYERALAITEKARGPDHPDVAGLLNGLAGLFEQTGDFTGARGRYERALGIMKKTFGPDHPQVALVMNNLGYALLYMGEYVEARSFLETALTIRRRTLGSDHPHVAATLWNLGRLHYLTGDFPAGKVLYEEALQVWQASLGQDNREVATTLHELASVAGARGDLADARSLHERALAMRERVYAGDHEDVALSLNSLGRVRSALGDESDARQLFQRALVMRERIFGKEHRDVAESLQCLADSFAATGELAQARPLYEGALRIREALLGPAHPAVAESLVGLGRLHSRQGEIRRAFDEAVKAEAISRSHLRLMARSLPERQALAYASVKATGLGLALSLAVDSRERLAGMEGQAWDALVRSRALILDEMAARHRVLVRADDPEVVRLAAAVLSARTRLANLTVRGPESRHPEGYRASLEAARESVEAAERSLASLSLAFRQDLAERQTGLADVVTKLPPSSALVAFALHDQSASTTASASQMTARAYLAFVIRERDNGPAVVPIGPAEEVDALVARWRVEVGREPVPGERTLERLDADARDAGMALRERVWDPVARHLGDARLVFVVPDGALSLVNFGALPGKGRGYLLEHGTRHHYLSAERDLVRQAATFRAGEGLLVMGGLDFDKADAGVGSAVAATPPTDRRAAFRGRPTECLDFRDVRFEPLPASALEAHSVAQLWATSASEPRRPPQREAAPRGQVMSLGGPKATERAFKLNAPGRQALHLATHGFFLEGRCRSALDASRGIGGLASPGVEPRAPTGENPLLLSGLVLAGANHRADSEQQDEDGILTAEEIAALDLSDVAWVVLSACDTAVGPIGAGEGVFGLRRAFQVAGAGTLIMSLWSVEDRTTREWMQSLYEARLIGHRPTSDAMHQAALEILSARRAGGRSTHPFYWAGFVAAGDWR